MIQLDPSFTAPRNLGGELPENVRIHGAASTNSDSVI